MVDDFRGQGWRFPILPDPAGRLGYAGGDNNVQQSLLILLLTRLGERVMRDDFGCKAPDLVFAPGTVQHLRLLEQTVREAVRDFEPRIELELVQAEVDAEQPTSITVRIEYRVRRTNTRDNLVFPFYLGTAEAI